MNIALQQPRAPADRHFFVTIDAETDVLREGLRVIADLRSELEQEFGATIPLTWFVRFQRSWMDYLANDRPEFFERPPDRVFDGFALALPELHELRDRGDEIAWHYHAYNYIQRVDLDHETRVSILETDLQACWAALQDRHPEFAIESFRFGWFFVPDYRLFGTLERLGITRDASVDPARRLLVKSSPVSYLSPITETPARIGPMTCFPFAQTLVVHDWEVASHDLGWSRLDEEGAGVQRVRLRGMLTEALTTMRSAGGRMSTYASFPMEDLCVKA